MKVKKLHIYLLIFLAFFSNYCKKKDYHKIFLDFSKESFHLDSLPWGIHYQEIYVSGNDFKVFKDDQKIEFSLIVNDKEMQKRIELSDEPFRFQITCYYHENICKVFKIRKIGNEEELNKFYKDFLSKNEIKSDKHLKKERKILKKSKTGNQIIETVKLYDLEKYILQLFEHHYIYMEKIKKIEKTPQNIDESDLEMEFMIFSKELNPNISIDYFYNNF